MTVSADQGMLNIRGIADEPHYQYMFLCSSLRIVSNCTCERRPHSHPIPSHQLIVGPVVGDLLRAPSAAKTYCESQECNPGRPYAWYQGYSKPVYRQ